MSNSLFDKTINSLGASTNLRLTRHNVVSSNIANAETPGYKAKKMDFESALKRAIEHEGLYSQGLVGGDEFPMGHGAISRVKADVYENPEINMSPDGNTVDLEREMAVLNENSIMYKAALQLINKKLGSMRYAVTEGAR